MYASLRVAFLLFRRQGQAPWRPFFFSSRSTQGFWAKKDRRLSRHRHGEAGSKDSGPLTLDKPPAPNRSGSSRDLISSHLISSQTYIVDLTTTALLCPDPNFNTPSMVDIDNTALCCVLLCEEKPCRRKGGCSSNLVPSHVCRSTIYQAAPRNKHDGNLL